MLGNYEYCIDASVSTQSVLEAASKENDNVSANSLGKIIKDIWEENVYRQYSTHSCVYIYRHLIRRALTSCEIISELDEDVVKNIKVLCSLHQGWIFHSQCRSNQTSLTLLKFFSPEKGEEYITVDGRRLIFEINIIPSPSPKLTLSTYGRAMPIEDIVGCDANYLSLRTIDNVIRLVESTVPCLGHAISENANTKFLKVPVLHSKNINVCSRDLGNHERLISSSCRLLTCRSSSSCQNCAYSLKLYQNRETKRKANVSEAPNKKEGTTKGDQFISQKLWFDIQSMIHGFISLVETKLRRFPGSIVKPAIINQDCVENHFSQLRGANGQNDNPTYQTTQGTQNSVIFGQTTISRKSNTGTEKSDSFAGLPKENLFGKKKRLQKSQPAMGLLI